LGRHALSAAPWRQLPALPTAPWWRQPTLSPAPAGTANASTPTTCTTPAIFGTSLLHPGVWPASAPGLRRQAAATPWRRPVRHLRAVTDGAVPIRGTASSQQSQSRRGVEVRRNRLAAMAVVMACAMPLSGCGYLSSAVGLDDGHAVQAERPSRLPLSSQPSIACVKDRTPSPTCFPAAPGRMSAWK
jgi:hypothetical protein